MQLAKNARYSFTCVDSGVDWITCTAAGKVARRLFLAEGEAILEEATAAGVDMKPAAVRDYVGWRVPGGFVGSRRQDDLIVLTSSHAALAWKRVARLATNVSRLDLQATLWTHGEQPQLSRWYYQRAKRMPLTRGRPRNYSLIQSHPTGDTLYVGERKSDCFGRIYDYAAAHKQGQPRTLWRFEVEFKRRHAMSYSDALLDTEVDRVASEHHVASWYSTRGFQLPWSLQESLHSEVATPGKLERDVLSWFSTSISKTVARAIRRHGLDAVLEALKLAELVMPRPRKEGKAYANFPARALSGEDRRGAARAVDGNAVLAARR